MALRPAEAPRPPEIAIPEDTPREVAALVDRAPSFTEHGAYLEQHHELTIKVIERVHVLLSRGAYDDATALVSAFRAKSDELWGVRVQQAEREVRP